MQAQEEEDLMAAKLLGGNGSVEFCLDRKSIARHGSDSIGLYSEPIKSGNGDLSPTHRFRVPLLETRCDHKRKFAFPCIFHFDPLFM